MSNSAMTLAVYFVQSGEESGKRRQENIRIHGAGCTHAVRDFRKYGEPLYVYAESLYGVIRQVKRADVRIYGVRVLPCAPIPEGFWSYTPAGNRLKLHATESAAKQLTRRVRNELDSFQPNAVTTSAINFLKGKGIASELKFK